MSARFWVAAWITAMSTLFAATGRAQPVEVPIIVGPSFQTPVLVSPGQTVDLSFPEPLPDLKPLSPSLNVVPLTADGTLYQVTVAPGATSGPVQLAAPAANGESHEIPTPLVVTAPQRGASGGKDGEAEEPHHAHGPEGDEDAGTSSVGPQAGPGGTQCSPSCPLPLLVGGAIGGAVALLIGIWAGGRGRLWWGAALVAAAGAAAAYVSSTPDQPAVAPVTGSDAAATPSGPDAGDDAGFDSNDWTKLLSSAECPAPCSAGSACKTSDTGDTSCASGFTCIPGTVRAGFAMGQRWNLVLSRVSEPDAGAPNVCGTGLRSATVCFGNTRPATCVPIADACDHSGRATVKVPITTEDLLFRPMTIEVRDRGRVLAHRARILYPRGLKRRALCVGGKLDGFSNEADNENPVGTVWFYLEPRSG
jgi:hypothetical protein